MNTHPATPAWHPHRYRQNTGGFTLIELMIVVVILGVLATTISLSITSRERSSLRYEAERLRLLLELSDSEALRSGATIRWRANDKGYAFHSSSSSSSINTTLDTRFRARQLSSDLRFASLNVEQRAVSPSEGMYFRPGSAPLFILVLTDAQSRIVLESQPDGSVHLISPETNGGAL